MIYNMYIDVYTQQHGAFIYLSCPNRCGTHWMQVNEELYLPLFLWDLLCLYMLGSLQYGVCVNPHFGYPLQV